jgi:hypothetical protein
MNKANFWTFILNSGEEVVLVSDLITDRQWMEDETNNSGFTPWMYIWHHHMQRDPRPGIPSYKNGEIFGRGRVNLDTVSTIAFFRMEISGSLSDLEKEDD